MTNKCDKCKTTDAPYYYAIAYPEDDGTTTTHYGCDMCIDQMHEMAAARAEVAELAAVLDTNDGAEYNNKYPLGR